MKNKNKYIKRRLELEAKLPNSGAALRKHLLKCLHPSYTTQENNLLLCVYCRQLFVKDSQPPTKGDL